MRVMKTTFNNETDSEFLASLMYEYEGPDREGIEVLAARKINAWKKRGPSGSVCHHFWCDTPMDP